MRTKSRLLFLPPFVREAQPLSSDRLSSRFRVLAAGSGSGHNGRSGFGAQHGRHTAFPVACFTRANVMHTTGLFLAILIGISASARRLHSPLLRRRPNRLRRHQPSRFPRRRISQRRSLRRQHPAGPPRRPIRIRDLCGTRQRPSAPADRRRQGVGRGSGTTAGDH